MSQPTRSKVLPDLPLDQIPNGSYRIKETGSLCMVVDGARYDIKPLDLDVDFKLIEAEVMKRRRGATEAIADIFAKLGDNEELKRAFVDKAWSDSRLAPEADKPTDDELKRFLSTREGIVWQLAYQLRKGNPDLDDSQVHDIVNKATDGELKRMFDLSLESNPVLEGISNVLEEHGVSGSDILKVTE